MTFTFPEKSLTEEEILDELKNIKAQSVDIYSPERLRQYSTRPHHLSLNVLNDFLPLNWNNIGMHTLRDGSLMGTKKLERELIYMLGDLMGSQNIDGYVTQGGTEGNLMGFWIGRDYLRKSGKGDRKIYLLKTKLSHYSIDKVTDILDIKEKINIELDEHYGMSVKNLKEVLENCYGDGIKNFLISLTLIYNRTGTIDEIDEIDKVLQEARGKMDIEFYVHVDAAIGGLIYPFIAEKRLDFSIKSVNSISLDFHKTGLMPHNAGVFLCRKKMFQYIKRPAPYLLGDKVDVSFSGSRPGAVAAACWSVLKLLGREGFKKHAQTCLDLKRYFLELLESESKILDYSYKTYIYSNIVEFYFKCFPEGRLPRSIERKYGLVPVRNEKDGNSTYSIVFMPHITKAALEEFARGICRAKLENTWT